MTPKYVYIAGPYTAPTLLERKLNCATAIGLGAVAIRQGFTPIIPHTMYHVLEQSFPETVFLRLGLELLALCQEVWVVDGHQGSAGTQEEITRAIQLGIPVVYEEDIIDEMQENYVKGRL